MTEETGRTSRSILGSEPVPPAQVWVLFFLIMCYFREHQYFREQTGYICLVLGNLCIESLKSMQIIERGLNQI